MPSRGPSILVILGAACLAACGGGGGGTPPPPPASHIAKYTGDSQVANVATQVQLQVLVTDTGGHAVADVPVAWAALGGGSVSAASSNSDALGVATIMRTLPSGAATVTTTATKAGLTGSPVTFTSVAQVNGAYRIQKFANDSQTDTVLATLGNPFRVHVTDYQNNNVASYTVNWNVTAGGGSVGAPTSNTDGSGIAQIFRTLGGTAGIQTAQASVTGLIGSPVTFTGIATPGHAAQLSFNSQNPTSGAPSSTVTLSVKALDAQGNGVAGIRVDWTATAGGGLIAPAVDTTNAIGVAAVSHTLSDSTRPDTVTATSTPALTGSPVKFGTTIATAPLTATDSVLNDVFVPDTIRIASGGTITWKWNSGAISHNVTFENSAVLGSPSATQSGTPTFSRTLTSVAPGTYRFECTIHGVTYTSGMVGVIIVQ
jgi:plastocyanin